MSSGFEQRFRERRRQFIQRALENLSTLDKHIEQLSAAAPADALPLVQRQFHKFAGAGGIYELTDFCKTSIEAEDLCANLISESRMPSTSELETLKVSCARMTALLLAQQPDDISQTDATSQTHGI